MESASGRFDPVARAARLIVPFCTPVSDFGTLRAVDPDAVPEPFRRLLDHSSHMTVVMERFHAAPVSLRVVATNESSGSAAAGEDATRSPGWYAREILLSDPQGRVVQHGIVRIDLKQVQPAVAATIRAATVPLGRILIDAGMLREVHDVRLLEIVPGPHLRRLWADGSPAERVAASVYGRVADISLGGRPAVELLEIVAPGPWPKVLL
jgi:chorismate-pyruvate lyase